jgi:hypothetical protein
MSSLTGQQYNSKNMTGLSTVYSTNIECDTIDVADEITLEPGGILTLPAASIQDSYLSANVAFRNQVNNFTLANNFAGTTTHTGITTNNGTSNFNAVMNVNNGTIQNFFATGATSNSRIQQTASGLQIVNGTSSQIIGLYTRTSLGVVGANLICQNGNTCYMQGDATNRILVSASTTPTLTIQAPLSSNDLSIVNSSWIVSQAFAKLAGPQTFTGNHNFPTQLTSDTSTLCATTAFVKNQNYITAAALTPYALLSPPSGQTFTGLNNFPTQATTDNSTLVATTAYVKNNLLDYGRLTLATGSTLQTWFGLNRFSSNSANLPISLQNTDAPTHGGGMFIASGNGQYNANVLQNDTVLLSTGTASGTGSLCLTTWSGNSVGIRIGSNIVVYNGATHTFNGTNNNFNGSVSLGLVGSTISLVGICSFTNTTTPVITQTIATGDNSTKIATTAWVRLQNYITSSALTPYALLASPNTFTALNTFNARVDNNATTFHYSDQRYVSVGGNLTSSQIYQNDAGLVIENINNSQIIGMVTRTSGGVSVRGFDCRNGNTAFMQGDLNNRITISGSTTPTISTQASSGSNDLSIANTAWIIAKNYITSSALTPYALLNPTTTQTFAGTGDNIFSNIATFNVGLQSNNNITLFSIGGGGQTSNIQQNNSGLTIRNIANSNSIILETRTSGGVAIENIKCSNGIDTTIRGSLTMLNEKIDMNANPIRFVDGLRSSQISQSGNALIIKNISNVSSVQLRSTTAGLVERTGITVQNGNETIIQGGTGIIRVLGNDATIECDNFKSNAPFECGYLQLGTPITAKTNYDIGYIWTIPGSSFTSWSGYTAFGNVVTIAWNGSSFSNNTTLGVWLCDICIATNTTSAMDSGFVLNITNNFVINTRSAWSNALTSFGVNQAQIVRLSTVLEITNLTDTYYLNFKINGGSARTDVPGASQMRFTRIA